MQARGKSSGEAVTLRQLLQLDKQRRADGPATSDYFWIVDYAGGSTTPTGFRMVKQAFERALRRSFRANDWGAPNRANVGQRSAI